MKLTLIVIGAILLTLGCDGSPRFVLGPTPLTTVPLPSLAPVPSPVPTFPSITVGEIVQFQFTTDDVRCVADGGRCRSYSITAPSDGQLEVAIESVGMDANFVSTTEMYVVPGGDYWNVGPGPRISVTIPARSGATYEIRMYSATVPSVELELRATLR